MSQSFYEAVDSLRQETQASLPTWNLSEYYKGLDDPQIEADIAKSLQAAKAFSEKYTGRVAELSGDEIAAALEERVLAKRGSDKAYYYSFFKKSVDGNNPDVAQLSQRVSEAMSEVEGEQLFFQLELRAIPDDVLLERLSESEHLQQYSKIIHDLIDSKKYVLHDEAEKILQRLSPVSAKNQFTRLYQEDATRRRYCFHGEELTEVELQLHQNSPDPKIRQEAHDEYERVTAKQIHIPVHAMSVIIKEKEILDEARGYTHPMQARNHSNNLEDEVVDTLIETVKENYPTTVQRLSKLRREAASINKQRGKTSASIATSVYTWEEARDMVLEAYRGFSPEMADIAEKFFKNGWIDAKPRPGKRGGAYSMAPHADYHPHILMNFQGRPRDVITLAHELGHGIQQYMEKEEQPEALRGTPLTLAETASIFGENLVFRQLMERASSLDEKRELLFNQLGGDINKAVRQIRFVDFERRIHEFRKTKEPTPADYGRMWHQTGEEMNGGDPNSIPKEDDLSQHYWSTIPHIFRTPFYVYAYSFGQLLVNSMFDAFEKGEIDNFSEKCVDTLKAGGTKHHKELLAPLGLDASTKEFWQNGLNVIVRRLDQLEELLAEQKAEINAAKAAEKEAASAPPVANDNSPVKLDSAEVVGGAVSETRAKGQGRA